MTDAAKFFYVKPRPEPTVSDAEREAIIRRGAFSPSQISSDYELRTPYFGRRKSDHGPMIADAVADAIVDVDALRLKLVRLRDALRMQ